MTGAPGPGGSLPTFVVIGAMKTGTSSLYAYLSAHPDVFMAPGKELDFFVDRRNWSRGLAWYEAQFRDGRTSPARGEASPLYTMAHTFPGVPERMARLLPRARLVYLVREPVARMRSHYLHRLAEGLERRPAAVALREHDGYLQTSRYGWQLEQYLAHFPPDQVLVVQSERLRAARRATVAQVLRFIGVDDGWDGPEEAGERHLTAEKRAVRPWAARLRSATGRPRNVDRWPEPARRAYRRATTRPLDPSLGEIPPEVDAELRERLAPDVARLRDLVGDAVTGWGLA